MPDPNADLIGFEFETEHGRARVTGTAEWSEQEYVAVEVTRPDGGTDATARLASLVRRAKQKGGSS